MSVSQCVCTCVCMRVPLVGTRPGMSSGPCIMCLPPWIHHWYIGHIQIRVPMPDAVCKQFGPKSDILLVLHHVAVQLPHEPRSHGASFKKGTHAENSWLPGVLSSTGSMALKAP